MKLAIRVSCILASLLVAGLLRGSDKNGVPPAATAEFVAMSAVVRMKASDSLTIMVTNDSDHPWVYAKGLQGPMNASFYLTNEQGGYLPYTLLEMPYYGKPQPMTLAPGESAPWEFKPSRHYPDLQHGWYQVHLKYSVPPNSIRWEELGVTPMSFERRVAWIHIPGAGAGPGPGKKTD